MATARKDAAEPAPAPATTPVIRSDEALEADLKSRRAASVVAEQAKRNDIVAREAFYARERERLNEREAKEVGALKSDIDCEIAVQAGIDAALASLSESRGSVVPVAAKPADDDGASNLKFLRPVEVIPAA